MFPRSNNFCYPSASKALKQSFPPALGQGCSLPLGGQIWEAPKVCLLILGQILESPPQIPVKLSSWGLSISLLLFLCCYYYKCDSQRWLYLGIQHPGKKAKKGEEERSGEHVAIQALYSTQLPPTHPTVFVVTKKSVGYHKVVEKQCQIDQ